MGLGKNYFKHLIAMFAPCKPTCENTFYHIIRVYLYWLHAANTLSIIAHQFVNIVLAFDKELYCHMFSIIEIEGQFCLFN